MFTRSSEASGPNRIITLTTDFGHRDPFVGEMKGVILSIAPRTAIVDIIHEIEPHDIDEASFVIANSHRYFPQGSVHVAVVDPGVGSERRAIILRSEGHYFVGPDNGIFSHILSRSRDWSAVRITSEGHTLSLKSPTFQGRDLFSPVAAWLSTGVPMEEFGPAVTDLVTRRIPLPSRHEDYIQGEVIHIDRFGNVITNIREEDLPTGKDFLSLELRGLVIPAVEHYSQAPDRGFRCLINSSGYVEIFLREGSAAEFLHASKGERVRIV